MDESINASASAPEPAPDGDATTNVLRGLGLALLGAAIAIDMIGPVIVGWRRSVALRATNWVDEAAPTENFLLDAAVELLRASETRRA